MEIESDVISNRNAKANPNDWLSNLSSDMRKNLFHIANRSGPIDVFILVWQSSWRYYTRWPTLISNKYPRNNKSEVATTTPRTSKYRTSKSLVDDADDVDVPAPFTYFAKKSNKKQTKKSNKKNRTKIGVPCFKYNSIPGYNRNFLCFPESYSTWWFHYQTTIIMQRSRDLAVFKCHENSYSMLISKCKFHANDERRILKSGCVQ